MTSHNLAERNLMVDWQVAPGCHEISNYDDVKIKYRQSVENIIHNMAPRNLKRMPIITISTNVMCADIETSVSRSRPHVEPIDRDVYFPLEICLTKSNVSEANKDREERNVKTLHFMVNPGPPPPNGSVQWSRDHKRHHKIDYENFRADDTYLTSDIRKIVKEINSFLTPERIVYSVELRNCRQDLGCLKWLNREANYIMKPVKVFSLEDLYVVLNRRLYPRLAQGNFFCQGVAKLRFERLDTYDPKIQCRYHQDRLKEDDEASTQYCAMAISQSRMHAILDDIFNFQLLEEDAQPE
jgi:hypothetical protein